MESFHFHIFRSYHIQHSKLQPIAPGSNAAISVTSSIFFPFHLHQNNFQNSTFYLQFLSFINVNHHPFHVTVPLTASLNTCLMFSFFLCSNFPYFHKKKSISSSSDVSFPCSKTSIKLLFDDFKGQFCPYSPNFLIIY